MRHTPTESSLGRRAAWKVSQSKAVPVIPRGPTTAGSWSLTRGRGVVVVGAGSFPYSASLGEIAAFLD